MQLFKQFEDTDSNYLYLLGIVVEGKPRKYLRAARRKFQTVMSPKIEAEGDGEPVRKKSVHIDWQSSALRVTEIVLNGPHCPLVALRRTAWLLAFHHKSGRCRQNPINTNRDDSKSSICLNVRFTGSVLTVQTTSHWQEHPLLVTKNTLFLQLLKNHIREGKSEYKYLNDFFLTEHLFCVIVLSKYYAKRSTKTPLGGAIVHYVNNFSLICMIWCAFFSCSVLLQIRPVPLTVQMWKYFVLV